MKTTIRIYTDNLTTDSLDPEATISAEDWDAARNQYIDMAIAAVRAEYPEADIDVEPGNGMKSFAAWVDADDAETEMRAGDRVAETVQTILEETYELWCETI
jgi:hypothetical protein